MIGNSPEILHGMLVLGMLLSSDDEQKQAETIAEVLLGVHDAELTAAFNHSGDGKGELQLDELKTAYRNVLQDAIDREAGIETRKSAQAAMSKFMDNNKPHPLGTVAEIAEKYHISKSEVRRLKQSGELEAYVADNAKMDAHLTEVLEEFDNGR